MLMSGRDDGTVQYCMFKYGAMLCCAVNIACHANASVHVYADAAGGAHADANANATATCIL